MSSRIDLVIELILSSYTADTIIFALKERSVHTKEILKSGEDLEAAKKRVESKDFLKQFIPIFKDFSIKELQYLINCHKSETGKKYNNLGDKFDPLVRAQREVLLEHSNTPVVQQSRIDVVRELISGEYVMDFMIERMEKQSVLTKEIVKSGEALKDARKTLRSDNFIKQFVQIFKDFSIEEMQDVITRGKSETIKKLKSIIDTLLPLTTAMSAELLESSPKPVKE